MEAVCIPIVLVVAGLGLLAAVAGLIVVLVKLGVIAQYAVREEPADTADYSLDESKEAGEG
ncbi:MAG: hypothetical protein M8467_00745 [Anaerolineae bacterium]|nr:hypothetical protein [Anaerolineae bacterium]